SLPALCKQQSPRQTKHGQFRPFSFHKDRISGGRYRQNVSLTVWVLREWGVCMCERERVCVCVCVSEREREREWRESHNPCGTLGVFHLSLHSSPRRIGRFFRG